MCGLVGIISKWNSGVFSRDVDMFKNMMFLDTLRGDDGTGVCIVNTEQGATVLKKSTDYPAYQY
jgi:glutamine phosphoribosylpyrophosphate amidotransferase